LLLITDSSQSVTHCSLLLVLLVLGLLVLVYIPLITPVGAAHMLGDVA